MNRLALGVLTASLALAACTGPTGADGANGTDGAKGRNGTNGSAGSNGANGASGDAGRSGANVAVRTLAAGNHCANDAGIAIETGTDTNANGTLDDNEVSSAAYVCRPIDTLVRSDHACGKSARCVTRIAGNSANAVSTASAC